MTGFGLVLDKELKNEDDTRDKNVKLFEEFVSLLVTYEGIFFLTKVSVIGYMMNLGTIYLHQVNNLSWNS
jgi:hypothetical protein